jgi:hypothetical protein
VILKSSLAQKVQYNVNTFVKNPDPQTCIGPCCNVRCRTFRFVQFLFSLSSCARFRTDQEVEESLLNCACPPDEDDPLPAAVLSVLAAHFRFLTRLKRGDCTKLLEQPPVISASPRSAALADFLVSLVLDMQQTRPESLESLSGLEPDVYRHVVNQLTALCQPASSIGSAGAHATRLLNALGMNRVHFNSNVSFITVLLNFILMENLYLC